MLVIVERKLIMEHTIEPCPFCGEAEVPTIIIRKGKDGWRDRFCVLCDYDRGGCGAESGWYHYEVEAVEAWNKRVKIIDKKMSKKIEAFKYWIDTNTDVGVTTLPEDLCREIYEILVN